MKIKSTEALLSMMKIVLEQGIEPCTIQPLPFSDGQMRDQAIQCGHETTAVGKKKMMLTGFDKFIIPLATSVEDSVLPIPSQTSYTSDIKYHCCETECCHIFPRAVIMLM